MTNKATRRLSDFDFSAGNAHVALVGPSVGGPANEQTVLVIKSVKDITKELVEKATKVQVTMDFEEFLSKFFCMYYEDAKVLATVLGMESEEQEYKVESYQDYINEKASAFTILKSLHNKEKDLSSLSAGDFVKVLESQEFLEKAVLQSEQLIDKNKKGKTLKEEIEKAVAQAESVLKAQLTAKEDELSKALNTINEMKAEKALSVEKARKEVLKSVVAEDAVDELLKSLQSLDDASFQAVVKNLGKKLPEKNDQTSDLFKEKGVAGDGKADAQALLDKTAEIIKARNKKK